MGSMASIHRDPRNPRGNWYCCYTLADGRRTMRSTGTKNRAQAKIICETWAATERAARDGSLSTNRAAEIINETLARCGQAQVKRLKLGEWFTEFLQAKTAASPKLIRRYRFAQTKFLESLGSDSENRFLDSINAADIRRFADQLLQEGRCATTINRIVRTDLGSAFGRAVRLGLLRFNPVSGVEPQKDQGMCEDRRTFTPEQIAKLIKTAQGTDWQGAILFGYSSDARLTDVANLRWTSVDLEEAVIVFRQRKTDQQTIVAIHPDFEHWLLAQPAPDSPQGSVFPALANREIGGKTGLTQEFNHIVRRSNRRRSASGTTWRVWTLTTQPLFHSLRHTAASNVFNAAAIKEVARHVTGHAGRGSLERYLHVDLTAIRSATALIPRLPLSE